MNGRPQESLGRNGLSQHHARSAASLYLVQNRWAYFKQAGCPMHQTHPGISKRLRRAKGHLDHVLEMLDEGRSCVELAQQLQAVEKAIGSAKKALIHDHLDHCLQGSKDGKGKSQSKNMVLEFRSISKYL